MDQHVDGEAAGTRPMSRRQAMATLGAAGAVLAGAGAQASGAAPDDPLGFDAKAGEFVLPSLPYAPDALEPHIDAETMRIHHDRHHAGYVRGLNRAMAELARIRSGQGDASLLAHWQRQLSFHGGGHANHTLFWFGMAPAGEGGGGRPTGALRAAIDRAFGDHDAFERHFQAAAGSVEGSGWGWLCYEPISGGLVISQMLNQQDLLFPGAVPLLGVDVWEHAYYLKYQNRRSDYVAAFLRVVNWPEIARRYERARTLHAE